MSANLEAEHEACEPVVKREDGGQVPEDRLGLFSGASLSAPRAELLAFVDVISFSF
jgi:hypothetical protein